MKNEKISSFPFIQMDLCYVKRKVRIFYQISRNQQKSNMLNKINKQQAHRIFKRPLMSMVSAEHFVPHPLVALPFGQHQVTLIFW